MKKFWYKPRNRAIVYSIGFVIVFGSYVIGAPRAPDAASVEPSLSTFTSSYSSSLPIAGTVIPLRQKITPTVKTVAEHQVLTHPNQQSFRETSSSNASDEPLSYDVNEMNASKEVKQKILKKLSGEKKDYPYEVEESENRDSPTYDTGKNAPGVVPSASGYIPGPTKTDVGSQAPTVSGLSSNSSLRKVGSIQSNNTKTILAAMNSNGEGQVEYNPDVQNPIPYELQKFYSHVHIFEFKKGAGGSTLYPSFGLDQESDYTDIRNVVFSPPDWQLDWKFTDENLDTAINRHLLPLGTNGTFTIQIQNGYISDQPGPDFLIVENPFCSITQDGKSTIIKNTASTMNPPSGAVCYPEPGRVEIGDTVTGKFYVFPCDGNSKTESWGCAGIVPNVYQPGGDLKNSGGDLFDLSKLKDLPKGFRVRYIRIVDLNNATGFEGTKGFDLDAFVPFNIQSEK